MRRKASLQTVVGYEYLEFICRFYNFSIVVSERKNRMDSECNIRLS